jgi:hypothetical protein
MVTSLYILEVLCYIRKHKADLIKNMNIHSLNTRINKDFHVKFCRTSLFKIKCGKHGGWMYSKMPHKIRKKNIADCNWVHLLHQPLVLVYQPIMIDDECGAFDGMIGRGNWSTGRNPLQLSLCWTQILRDLNWARTQVATVGRFCPYEWIMTVVSFTTRS